ncbi:MAG: 50S ribosomal protein L18 [Nitrospinaceae bacterium]|nr:50S ribosomal protein L18 [Nitrospinaceae bacterium]NIR55543.1 50S ribosomal protein L18 [Nitrospinaceae bacterium]NIS85977.1 50S ribosomal protein L18 [Nitrospinaceae bacterium]NIT82823.1 50S ribosomal protein L18 [Nitrospinaceae bacterium]NIU45025.1 50S ribosomal protein L18 [Nitrospinaceae bacterium]
MSATLRRHRRLYRKRRVKTKVQRDPEKLRLTVFKSSKHIYAQIVNDRERRTVVSESTTSKAFREQMQYGGNVKAAALVGAMLGEKAVKNGIQNVYYDRNGFIYTGRVKALADAVREKGVKF